MKERWRCVSIGPVAMLRPPPGISSQTQPDGRSVYSVFPSRLGQRGIAPLGARPLDEPRRQVEIDERHVLHAVGVQQRRRVLPEHRPEGARGRREAERAAGLGVHVRHGQRQVGRDEPVEPDSGALGQQLPDLDVVALAGALLLASIYFSPFSPTYFRQSRQRGCAGFANADAPLSASRLPPPSRPRRRWIRPSGGTTVPLS